MPETANQQLVSRQVERIVRQLTSLSTLPAVAATLLTTINDQHADPVSLTEQIQADPALTAKVLSVAHQQGVRFESAPTISEAVAKLPMSLLREAVISVKVFGVDSDTQIQQINSDFRRDMALHSLAVGCFAERIAELTLEPSQRQTAYLAGLLHDIGKCALDEVMPKGFSKMVQQARDAQSGLSEIEQTHLGLDHAVLGKRLGQKWSLPEPVTSAIWLHHCDAQALAADLPDIEIARVVALADRLARRSEIGHSGSYDVPEGIAEFADLLSLRIELLDELSGSLAETIQERSCRLGLGVAAETSRYYEMIHKTAAELARDNNQLSVGAEQQSRLREQIALIEDFLNEVDENATAIEAAQVLAAGWKKQCHSGMTCVYVCPNSTEPYVELTAVDRQGRTTVRTLHMPDGIPPIPEVFRRNRSTVQVADGARWLVEQLELDFDPSKLKMAPLKMGDEVVGVLVFEQLVPGDAADDETAPLACQVAASVIAMAQAGRKHELLADRFVQVMSSLRQARAELARQQSLAGLAEMAAGAAHELNNPLSVISGRAQLLMSTEADEDKKQILVQIQQRADEITHIVSDLLSFARPAVPLKRSVSVRDLMDAAIEAACETLGTQTMEVDISGEAVEDGVYVDVHQAMQSLTFVLVNAQQAYKGGGPVRVACEKSPMSNAVWVAIQDNGRGMNAETLKHACQPFYSGHPAGRQRGMGLAHAQRLLLHNGGDLKITSEQGEGTTVTVILPKV